MSARKPTAAIEENKHNARNIESAPKGGSKSSVVAELAGLVKGAGDVDWRRDYADYLAEKYK